MDINPVEQEEQLCSNVFECPDRYVCYDGGGEVHECLCFRFYLIHGDQCGEIPPLAVMTFGYLAVIYMLSFREYFIRVCRLYFGGTTAFTMRRRISTPLVVGVCMGLHYLVTFMICSIHLLYLWVYPGQWWEMYGFIVMTGFAAVFLEVSVVVILLDFFKKLVLVQVVNKSYAQKVLWLVLLVVVNFLGVAVGVFSRFDEPFTVLSLVITAPILSLVFSFTLASGKLRAFLIRSCLAERMEPYRSGEPYATFRATFQAVSVLSRFSNHFRVWLLALLFAFQGAVASEQNPSVPNLIPHLFGIAAYRIYIQLGQVMMNFCLPAGTSTLVLIAPEKRLWTVLTGMPLRNLPHYFDKIMQSLRNLTHYFGKVKQCAWARVVRCGKKPQRVAPAALPTAGTDGTSWGLVQQERMPAENFLGSPNAFIYLSYLNSSEGYGGPHVNP